MRAIKTFIFSFIFILFLNNLSNACDFLGINIGGNKSEIEKYFGVINDLDEMIVDPENTDEETYEDDEQKTREGLTLSAPIDDFCPDSNLGNAIIHAHILEDKIVDNASDVDLGLIFGIGFPPFRGGLLKYADTEGLDRIHKALEGFCESVSADRYTPAPFLENLVKEKKRFYQLG